MVLGTEKELLFALSTFALFCLGFSLNCSHRIDTGRWSLDVVCTDFVQENSKNKYECIIRAYPKYYKETVKVDVSFEAVHGSTSLKRIKLNCSTKFNLPNITGTYTYKVFLGTEWSTGKKIVELKIEDPGEPILKNCPTYVKEGDHVTCQCSTEHRGSPPPILSWPEHTDSSILELHDVTLDLNMTRYKCEMTWGMKAKTDFYTLMITPNSERKDMDTTQTSTITIVSVVGTVVLVVIIMTTVIVIVIIRRKRNQLKNCPPSPEPTENMYYVDCLSDNGKDFVMSGDDYADITDCTRHAADTVMPDLYTSVKTEEGRQTTQADVYATVEKNKQHGKSEVYALVVKPQGKQPAKADNSSDFTHEADVYAVVDKGAKC